MKNKHNLLYIYTLFILCSACSGAEEREGADAVQRPVSAPASAPSAEAPAPPECEEGARRCQGERQAAVCRGGAWQAEPCGEEARCLGLSGAEAVCRPAGPGWLASREGFVNRWRMAGPLDRKTVRKLEGTAALVAHADSDGGWSVESFNTGVLELEGRRKWGDKREPTWLLQAQVWSPRAQRVRLRPSVTGSMEVWINDAQVFSATAERWLLVDDNRAEASLRAGWNAVLVRLEQEPPRALRMALRVRDLDNQPIEGLIWAVPGDASSAPSGCETLALAPTLRPAPEGRWQVEVSVEAPGLVSLPQPDQAPRALDVVLSPQERGGEGQRVYSAPLEAGALARGAQRHAFTVAPERDGAWWLQVRRGDAVCASFPLRQRTGLQSRLVAVEEALTRLEAQRGVAVPLASLESLLHHAAVVRELLASGDRDDAYIGRELEDLEQRAGDALAGRDPYTTRAGLQRRAYRSPFDGKLQGYLVWVPPSYVKRSEENFPLIVTFHGLNGSPEEMLRITMGIEQPPGMSRQDFARMPVRLRDERALVVAPWGYGNVGQRVPGEVDVLRVIEEVEAAYRVDPRRVSLTGASLGGTVAFVVPLHYPDRFAAAAPLCGYPNLRSYNDVQRADKRPWERWLVEQRSIANYAEAGLYLPLYITHGTRDAPSRSEEVVKRYRALGLTVDFDTPDLGHNVWDHAYAPSRRLLRKLASRRVPAHPRRAHLRTGHLRYNRAQWLQLDRAAAVEGELAELEGARGKDGRVEITTRGVEAFTVLGPRLSAEVREVELIVDGARLPGASTGGPIHLTRRAGRWALTDAPDVPEGHKRAGLSGPLDDVWFSPLVVVYGTQDPRQTEANRLAAEHAARYNLRTELIAPIYADHEITEDALRGRNVILIGNPRSNTWARQAAAALPVKFEDHALDFFGQRYEGDEIGVSFIHPSPFDPARYLVWHAGVTEEGTLSSRHLPELSPDYLVYDSRVRAAYWGPVLDNRQVLSGGFFSEAWTMK